MELLDLGKTNSENLPTCRVCGQPMQLLDKDEQRWYCYKDDKVWLGKEQKWQDEIPPEAEVTRKMKQLEKAKSEDLPVCRGCGRLMQLLDEDEQRYYCSRDNQVWLGKEQRWEGTPVPLALQRVNMPLYDALYVDGYRNLTSKIATISLCEESIKITFSDPSSDPFAALEVEIPYSSIEVLNIALQREITALRTWLIGPVFAAWFKKTTLTLIIGLREKDGLLQLPSFKMETSIINDCYDRLYERVQKARAK